MLRALLVALLLAACPSIVQADIVFYTIPGTTLTFLLQGSAKINPGQTVTFRHQAFGNLYMGAHDVRILKTKPTSSIAMQMRRGAEADQDLDKCFAAARFALRTGQLKEFYANAANAWKIAPENAAVTRLVNMKREIDKTVPINPAQKKTMEDYMKNRPGMEFTRSKHYVLMHDTGNKINKRTKLTRAQERLKLLEIVYESYMMKFSLEGVMLTVPKEPLMVVLFSEYDDYLGFSSSISPTLASTAGFFDRKSQIAVFFDQGTDDTFDFLYKINTQLQIEKKRLMRTREPGAKDRIRLADTLQLLIEVNRANLDIEVVSHEATHQLAGNTGLMPGDSPVPVWAAEGLATYFESPKEAAWGGIGAVNEERLELYRYLAPVTDISNIRFIVTDQIFTRASSNFSTMHAYAQSWALTHFLMDRHFTKLMKYYQKLSEHKGNLRLSEEKYIEIFTEAFEGRTIDQLDLEWKSYMRGLKTDLERVLNR
ncbi:MAG: hypothetical protein COA78_11865 [Blastopirellula sp.]|nr:MAG: hypothetical protein COA78_11865 [Blastopirellula sp.]